MKLRAAVLAAAFAGVTVLMAALPAPARADWIVTRQGERFEVKGGWQQKGKLVVFTLPNGSLSSIRADRVDFEASKRATEQAKKEAEAPPPPEPAKVKRKAVIVLTDKDFRKGSPPAEAGSAEAKAATAHAPGSGSGGKDKPPSKDVPSSVEVVSWERVPASESKANGAEITGTVRNVSQDLLTEVTVVAQLFDDNGGLIGRYPAVLDTQQLPPTESSKFRVVVPGVYAFASLRWETQGRGIRGLAPGGQAATPPSGR